MSIQKCNKCGRGVEKGNSHMCCEISFAESYLLEKKQRINAKKILKQNIIKPKGEPK